MPSCPSGCNLKALNCYSSIFFFFLLYILLCPILIKFSFSGKEIPMQLSVSLRSALALSRSLQSSPTANFLPYMAESFTLLAKWLQQHTSPSCAPLRNIGTLKELANVSDGEVNQNTIISKLMERASQFAPSSSEAWLAWGQFQ